MEKEKVFNSDISTLPKKINERLVDNCKAKFFEKNKALVNVFKPINNSWFRPIQGA